MQPTAHQPLNLSVRRVRWIFAMIAVLMGIFLVRAFYVQVIRHEYYRKVALSDQLKQYEIPATRGIIEAHSGGQVVPIVLNQTLYTVYVDPTLVKDINKDAVMLTNVLGGKTDDYVRAMQTKGTSYVVVARKVDGAKQKQIMGHKYAGIGAQALSYRTYPDGALASQVLGFVNADGQGTYGLEQALNKRLAGTAGQLKAVTDINGVPLAANTGNIQVAPVPGDTMVLTLDMAMQQQLEGILAAGVKGAHSNQGSALIMDLNSGAIKAMANYPTYDPSNYGEVSDPSVFSNAAVGSSLEVGSIMKTLTTAAALDSGAITASETYSDPAHWKVDGFNITNIEQDGGAGTKSITDILNLSLNTGATWELMQMSKKGGTDITQKGRETWYDYMTNHYRLGKLTGIEQGYEDPGIIPDPNDGYARDLTYANTSFGQGMRATILQMAAAFSAVMNGGTYYQPHFIEGTLGAGGREVLAQPKILQKNVVSPQVSSEMQSMLEQVVVGHSLNFDQKMYSVGGKTGTAQIAKQGGGYLDNDFNGTYLGFVGGDKPQYVIAVSVIDPKLPGWQYAGTAAAQPIFANLAHMLIDDFGVTAKGQ